MILKPNLLCYWLVHSFFSVYNYENASNHLKISKSLKVNESNEPWSYILSRQFYILYYRVDLGLFNVLVMVHTSTHTHTHTHIHTHTQIKGMGKSGGR